MILVNGTVFKSDIKIERVSFETFGKKDEILRLGISTCALAALALLLEVVVCQERPNAVFYFLALLPYRFLTHPERSLLQMTFFEPFQFLLLRLPLSNFMTLNAPVMLASLAALPLGLLLILGGVACLLQKVGKFGRIERGVKAVAGLMSLFVQLAAAGFVAQLNAINIAVGTFLLLLLCTLPFYTRIVTTLPSIILSSLMFILNSIDNPVPSFYLLIPLLVLFAFITSKHLLTFI